MSGRRKRRRVTGSEAREGRSKRSRAGRDAGPRMLDIEGEP